MVCLNSNGRSIKQRLISKFPSLYILFNIKDTGVKNALVNIKGYKSVKSNNLLDIEFYLKNNKSVRLSGMDPILHYMYHGFKEGKKPNPAFDGDYYLKRYSDVKNSDLNPLVHYGLYGINEGRSTHEFKVSIIMSTYNRRCIIKRAIDSILNQSFSNYELIICDDGSTDNTEKLLKKEYAHYFKSGKFIYITQNHVGVSKARNRCLEISSGNLVAYLDSDNYWEPEFLEKMVGIFQNNSNCDSAYCAIHKHYLDTNKNYILNERYDRDKILKKNQIDLNTFMHRKNLYELLGGFNESLTRLVDWDLILMYTKDNPPLFLDEILVQYYIAKKFNNITLQGSYTEHCEKIYNIHSDEIINRAVSKTNFIEDPFITLHYLKLKKPTYFPNYLRIGIIIDGKLNSLMSSSYICSLLKHLSLEEKSKVFIYDNDDFSKLDTTNIMKCKLFDVIIIQKNVFNVEIADMILKKCKDNDIEVYELDEDLLVNSDRLCSLRK